LASYGRLDILVNNRRGDRFPSARENVRRYYLGFIS
jgi:hypothetical protein